MSSTPDAARGGARWICPSCDTSPSIPEGTEEPACPSCSTRLVQLNRREDDDMVGQVIDGRFEIRAFLGEGGMGTVYKAWQRSIGREVAIKLIDKRHSRDEMAVRRFLREARLASQLSQPNTVSIFDVGQSKDGRLFLVMELIRGRTLEQVVDDHGAFSVMRAARVGVQLCDALEAAGRLQIVHRDLKPANVIVLDDPPGRDLIKVLDFGLAKSLTGDESSATQSGLIVGTPRYMAPEVLMGAAQTMSSDLYAVGVILGEIAAGAVMWKATSFPVLLAHKVDGSTMTAQLAAPLRAIVERLIAAEPARRFAGPIELRDALLPLVEGRGGEGHAVTVELPAAASAAKPGLPTVELMPVELMPVELVPLILEPLPPAPAMQVKFDSPPSEVTPAQLELAVVPPRRLIGTPTPAPRGSGTAMASGVHDRRRPVALIATLVALAVIAIVTVVLATRGGGARSQPAAVDGAVDDPVTEGTPAIAPPPVDVAPPPVDVAPVKPKRGKHDRRGSASPSD